MKPFATCLFVAAIVAGVVSADGVDKWESYKAKHGKQHSGEEDASRMRTFLERDAHIEAHNARYAAGLESYSLRHNQYSDLTAEEFSNSRLGFVPVVNETIPLAEVPVMPNAPDQFDWQSHGIVTPVRDQGYCGSCYAFAAGGVLEAILKWKQGMTADLSEQSVVDCSFRRFMGGSMNGGCQGGHPTAVYDYWNMRDVIPENRYPYTSGRSQRHGFCQIEDMGGNLVRGRIRARHVLPRNEDEIANILLSKGPIVLGMAADNEYKDFFNDLGDGVFDNNKTINLQPNHVVVLTGYGIKNGKRFWMIKNSWGAQWADRGYGRIVRGKNMCNIMASGVWYLE